MPISIRKIFISVFLVICFVLCGCSDSKPAAASKQVRQAADTAGTKAAEAARQRSMLKITLDQQVEALEKTIAELDSVIAKTRSLQPSKDVVDSALKVSAQLTFEQGTVFLRSLDQYTIPMKKAADEITGRMLKLNELQVKKMSLQKQIESHQVQQSQIDYMIAGDQETKGLQQFRDEWLRKQKKLQAEKDELAAIQKQTTATAYEVQLKADELSRQAEKATGDQKYQFQRQSLELLLKKKTPLDTEIQAVADQIKAIDDQLAIVVPMYEKNQADLEAAEKSRQDLKDSDLGEKLNGQLDGYQSQIDREGARIAKLLVDSIERDADQYAAATEKVAAFFTSASEKYAKIKGLELKPIASVGQADCYSWAGSSYYSCLDHMNGIGMRLESISESLKGPVADDMNAVAKKCFALSDKAIENAKVNYDASIKKYEEISGTLSRFGKDFANKAARGRILALYGLIAVEETIGSDSELDKMYDSLDELAEEAEKNDPEFVRSTTSRLLQGQLDYVPLMYVDETEFLAEFKKAIQDWKDLSGSEQEDRVLGLIEELEELKETAEPKAFDQILAPELQALKAAVEKGFEEDDEIDSGSGRPSSTGGRDPNFM